MKLPLSSMYQYLSLSSQQEESLITELANKGLLIEGQEDIGQETIYALETLPHRGDWLSVRGCAREIAALYNIEWSNLHWEQSLYMGTVQKNQNQIMINNIDHPMIQSYIAFEVTDIVPQESPEWLQQYLQWIGISSQNLAVDLTNYICHYLGQPLHVFDRDTIQSKTLSFEESRSNDIFYDIQGTKHTLPKGILTLRDNLSIHALPGVIGSQLSAVSSQTTSLILESALFNMNSIRNTMNATRLNTDASDRFSRGVDPNIINEAALYWLGLFTQLQPQATVSLIIRHQTIPSKVSITTTKQRVKHILGQEYPFEEIKQWFKYYDIFCWEEDSKWTFSIPSFRHDLTRDNDIMEEIIRIEGYEKNDAEVLYVPITAKKENYHPQNKAHELTNVALQKGFQEVINFSFIPSQYNSDGVQVPHPVSEKLNTLRHTLIYGLCSNIKHNIQYNPKSIHKFWNLCEFGTVFYEQSKDSIQEKIHFAMISSQDFNHFKSAVDDIHYHLKVTPSHYKAGSLNFAQSCQEIYQGEIQIAWIGQVQPSLVSDSNIKKLWFAEWDLSLEIYSQQPKRKFQMLCNQPIIERDCVLLLKEETPYYQVYQVLQSSLPVECINIEFFDEYQGEQIPANHKSLGFRLTFQHNSKTLTSQEVDSWFNQLLKSCQEQLGATLREK